LEENMKMGNRWVRVAAVAVWAGLSLAGTSRAEPSGPEARSALVPWFQSTEQALMDAVASGDKTVWDRLRPFIPLTPDAFVLSGRLGEWIFVSENGRAVRILNFRKFEPLVWSRVDDRP